MKHIHLHCTCSHTRGHTVSCVMDGDLQPRSCRSYLDNESSDLQALHCDSYRIKTLFKSLSLIVIIWKTPHSPYSHHEICLCVLRRWNEHLWRGKTLNQEEEEISHFVPVADAEILDNDCHVLHSRYLIHESWNSYSARFVYIFISAAVPVFLIKHLYGALT